MGAAGDRGGKARRLRQHVLAEKARGRGLEEIYGDVLSTNRPMLEFCRKLGFKLGRNPDDATVTRVTLLLN